MTQSIQSLVWQDQSDANEPIANYDLDFSLDPVWQFNNLYSTYHANPIFPNGVFIDNSANNATIVVISGANQTSVPPFQRVAVDLPKNTQSVMMTCGIGIVVPIQFYIVSPSPSNLTTNYAGAAALANTVVFNGGVTTGAANAQAITVASTYTYTNAVIVTGTAGFTNTGALTMNVNGMGNIPVTNANGNPLIGGEFVLGQNFEISANVVAGTYNLISAPTGISARAMVTFDIGGNILKQYNVSSVTLVGTSYNVVFTNPMPDNAYGSQATVQDNIALVGTVGVKTVNGCRVVLINTTTQAGQVGPGSLVVFG